MLVRYAPGMDTMVALLRGINVGGKNRLPMQDLRELLTELGCEDVKTYIQSGNAVFRCDADIVALPKLICSAIEERFGFGPQVLVMTASRFESIVAGNPFAGKVADPRSVHVSFLEEEAIAADVERMHSECKDNESFRLTKHALYFHAPDGIGRSAFASKAEKLLGVAATGRNWRTVCKIADIMRSVV